MTKNKNIRQDSTAKVGNSVNTVDGIITQKYGNNTYTFWHIADVVHPYISKFLKKEFPNSVIIREFNKIDHIVLKENLPVEVQSTSAHNYNGKQKLAHSSFEQKIEGQLRQKIDKYGKGIFIFDSEYLRYLQTDITSASRIRWDWFYHHMKEGILRVFVIRYDGIVREVFLKDFEFISKISQTCPISRESDERILERNKLVIMNNVLEWYKFTTDEFNKMYDAFKLSGSDDFDAWLNRDGHTDRETLYYYINRAMTTLKDINNVLACRIDINKKSYIRTYAHYMKILGLIDFKSVGTAADMRIFADYPKIAEYFPGYIINKGLWDGLKNRYIRYNTFCGVATGEIDEKNLGCQISIDKAWGV
jgi:hypothetical protein